MLRSIRSRKHLPTESYREEALPIGRRDRGIWHLSTIFSGAMPSLVYANKPTTLDELETSINILVFICRDNAAKIGSSNIKLALANAALQMASK